MVSGTTLIFHISTPCGKTFSVVQRPRLSVKVNVKYQGHIFSKDGAGGGGALVFNTLTFLSFILFFYHPWRQKGLVRPNREKTPRTCPLREISQFVTMF